MWGTWSLGFFASGKFGATGPVGADNSSPVAGLFYGGGTSVLKAQLLGNLTITAATFVVALIMMWVIKQLPHPWNLRVEGKGEVGAGGLDVWEHGSSAYPEIAEDFELPLEPKPAIAITKTKIPS